MLSMSEEEFKRIYHLNEGDSGVTATGPDNTGKGVDTQSQNNQKRGPIIKNGKIIEVYEDSEAENEREEEKSYESYNFTKDSKIVPKRGRQLIDSLASSSGVEDDKSSLLSRKRAKPKIIIQFTFEGSKQKN